MAKRFNSRLWHSNSKRMPKPLEVRSNSKRELAEEIKEIGNDIFNSEGREGRREGLGS